MKLVTCIVLVTVAASASAGGGREDVCKESEIRRRAEAGETHLECPRGDLRKMNLSQLKIISGNFYYAFFDDAHMYGIQIYDSSFMLAQMPDAELSNATFWYTDFGSASFRNATMYRVTIIGGNYERADFTGADLKRGTLREGRRNLFADANVSNADFEGFSFESGATLNGAWAWAQYPPKGLSDEQLAVVDLCETPEGTYDATKKPEGC